MLVVKKVNDIFERIILLYLAKALYEHMIKIYKDSTN